MPAEASLEDLTEVNNKLQQISSDHPEAYREMSELFRSYRRVGYKNICKLLLGEATPEKLKGLA